MNILKYSLAVAALIGLMEGFIRLLTFAVLQLSDEAYNASIDHILGISEILFHVLVYTGFIYFIGRDVKRGSSGATDRISSIGITPVLLLMALALGIHLIDIPLFEFKELSNIFFGTDFKIAPSKESAWEITYVYTVVSVVLVAPIFEELLFRHCIFRGLLLKNGLLTSLLVSGILFSAIHYASIRNLLPTFIFGVFSAYVYYKSGNLFYSILLHAMINVLWLVSSYNSFLYDTLLNEYRNGFLYWSLFILGVLLSYIAVRQFSKSTEQLASSQL